MSKQSMIRFCNNKSNWEKVILSDHYDISIGFTPSTTNPYFWNGEYNWLSISDLSKNGKYIQNTQKHISKDGADSHKIIKKGTVVMSFKLTVGSVGILNTDMFTNEAICHFNYSDSSVLDNEFLYYSLYKIDLSKFGQQAVKGVTLNSKSLKDIFIYAPLIDEQKQIASFLSQLDVLILNEQKRYEKLQNLKNTMLNKLFPQKGSNTPEIRFKEFIEKWNDLTFKDCFIERNESMPNGELLSITINSGIKRFVELNKHNASYKKVNITDIADISIGLVTTMTKYYVEEGVPLIRNSDIKTNKLSPIKEMIKLDKKFTEKHKHRKLKCGDIVTVHTGNIGTSAVITKELDGCLGFATINTRVKDLSVINNYYLSHYFNSHIFKQFALKVKTGDGRDNFNLKDFTKATILVPNIEEQKKIVSLLSELDKLIDSYNQKLEKLQNLKSSLLDKMFV